MINFFCTIHILLTLSACGINNCSKYKHILLCLVYWKYFLVKISFLYVFNLIYLFDAFVQHTEKHSTTTVWICMRNEYFIYNQFIKIKYKIISKEKKQQLNKNKKNHCTRHWYDTNDIINLNNYNYIQCKKNKTLDTFFPMENFME